MLALLIFAAVVSAAVAFLSALLLVRVYGEPTGRDRTLGLIGWGLVGLGSLGHLASLCVFGFGS